MISSDAQSTATLPPLAILKKLIFFEKKSKTPIYFQKTEFSYVFRKFPVSVALHGKSAMTW